MLELLGKCPFPGLYEIDKSETEAVSIGYFRADYDGYRWYDTVFPSNRHLVTDELAKEFDKLFFDTTEKFPTLKALVEFCETNAEQVGERGLDVEYNLYADGKYGLYWLRVTPRSGDYNLRVRCYSKAEIRQRNIQTEGD